LGRVSPTPIPQKTKKIATIPPLPQFCHDRHSYGGRHGAAIRNPKRHRYLVAVFQIPATLFRHSRYLITLFENEFILPASTMEATARI